VYTVYGVTAGASVLLARGLLIALGGPHQV
jgi:hypothetical protein